MWHYQNTAPAEAAWLQTPLLDDPSPNSASNSPLLPSDKLVDPIYNGISHCRSRLRDKITLMGAPISLHPHEESPALRLSMTCQIPSPKQEGLALKGQERSQPTKP